MDLKFFQSPKGEMPCIGPPGTIAAGSPTVMIGNKMAARTGAQMVHGGGIVADCPTVVFWDSGD